MKHHLLYRTKSAAEQIKLRVWPVVHRLAWPVVWLRRRLRPHKISVRRLEGTVTGAEQPLAILCGAATQNQEYLKHVVFAQVTRESEPAIVRLIDAFRPKSGREQNCSLVILETTQSHRDWLDDGGWFFIPTWVRGEVNLPLPEKTLRSDTFQTIRRKIRKYKYEYMAVRELEQLKDFYDQMHVPYISKTYGAEAVMQSHAEIQGRCVDAGFDLIMIRSQDRPDSFLAGCLIIYELARPRLWMFGVRDGDAELVRQGVLSSLYLFCFEHLLKQGFSQVSTGGNRPFLRDGVLTMKKRLSQTIVGGRWEGFALRVLDLNPATRAFLVNQPFFFRVHDRIHGALFTEAPLTVKTVAELDHDYFYPGMHQLMIYFFAWDEQFRFSDLPAEVAARVQVRPAVELVSGRLRLP